MPKFNEIRFKITIYEVDNIYIGTGSYTSGKNSKVYKYNINCTSTYKYNNGTGNYCVDSGKMSLLTFASKLKSIAISITINIILFMSRWTNITIKFMIISFSISYNLKYKIEETRTKTKRTNMQDYGFPQIQ